MFINFLISLFIFFIGSIGVFLSRKNLILSLISLEIMLLSINMNFLFFSIHTDTIFGYLSTFFILVIGAAESAIGLAFVIIYYKGYRYYY